MTQKNYDVRCEHCHFRKQGSLEEFQQLIPVQGCNSCGGHRFKCPNCGYLIRARRIFEEVKEDK